MHTSDAPDTAHSRRDMDCVAEHQTDDDHLDKETFFKSLGAGARHSQTGQSYKTPEQ
jgi:hypothetical protein